MGKSRRNFFYLFAVLFLGFLSQNLFAQTDLYNFPKIEDEIKVKEFKRPRPSDPFLTVLSRKTSAPIQWLEKYFSMGVGRSELIRLALISKKSENKLDEITKEYEKGTSIKKIALSYGLDYSSIRKEASKILREAEEEFEKEKAKKLQPAPTAGVEERTTPHPNPLPKGEGTRDVPVPKGEGTRPDQK